MKEEQKNFVLFAVFAALILFGWPVISRWVFPQQPPAPAKMVDGKLQPVPNPGADPAANSPKAIRNRDAVLAETPRVEIETPALQGSINLKGLRIDDLVLREYDQTVAKNSPPIRLLSPSGAEGAYFAQFGWQGPNVPDANTVWQADGDKLTPATPVKLTATNSAGQVFQVELAVDSNFMFTVRQTVANRAGAPVAVTPYTLISRGQRSADTSQWAAHVGPVAATSDAANYIDWKDIESTPQQFATTGGWVGFSDHYWLTAAIPDQRASVNIQQRGTAAQQYQADVARSQPISVQPGQQSSYTSHFFAGAKEVKLLDAYQKQYDIAKFERAIDWGWFEIIERPIFTYLSWLFSVVKNFGVAIILLTITIRALLFPIAQRQFASMAKMRQVQPKMKAIQERFKDDKPRQQQEIMKLYKDEKVNPLAGCAPMLLQIPIMFALYKVLLLTIEMRHQPFALWIRDLSAPDPATILNLFGYLHFTPPSFLAIGVVPVLLGVSMYFQMKFNPAPMDEMQKQVFAIMPWMLMFLMAPFAVGLQIYWITSNVLTVLQQQLLYARHPEMKVPVEKPSAAKAK
ncbi:membrane protein insertase YidC [Sphingomonas sp. HT-1]|uniref:membrane protein insertase YidC n=1 Tax=unclassified Sphingomonas TaxID=196159 RepID=UPI00031E9F67|nr:MULTISPECIES: membrane protein insertase YidC [unclassified Sphingomonas]KTF67629.1 preprotein translocase YidC [Sphingomonas sp. WG]